jgi:hypothetical protein
MAVPRLYERNSGLALSGKFTLAGLTIHSCISAIRKHRNTGFYSMPATRADYTVHLVKVHYQANRDTNLDDRGSCCQESVFQNQPVYRSNSIIFILIILYYSMSGFLTLYHSFFGHLTRVFRTPIVIISDTY